MGIQKLESKMLDETFGQALGYRNLIINGACDIWQRGTTKANGAGAAYLCDRWVSQTNAAVSRSTDVPSNSGFRYSHKISNYTVGQGFQINQYIEHFGQFYNGQKVTISVYLKASNACSLTQWGGLYWAGTNATASSTSKTIDLTTSWQRFTITQTLQNYDAATCTSLAVYPVGNFSIATGITNSTEVYFTGFQLEIGETATPFERRPYGLELALCQRYYYRMEIVANGLYAIGGASSSTDAQTTTFFPVVMRTSPSLSSSAGSTFLQQTYQLNSTPTGISAQITSPYSASINSTGGSGLASGAVVKLLDKTGSSYIAFDAEL